MAESHVFDPKKVEVLEAEEWKTWQNPEEVLETIELNCDYVAADLRVRKRFLYSSPFS